MSMKITVIAGMYKKDISDIMIDGVLKFFNSKITSGELTSKEVNVVWVNGAFEMPLAYKQVVQRGNTDGVIIIGQIIHNNTPYGTTMSKIVRTSIIDQSVATNTLTTWGLAEAGDADALMKQQLRKDRMNEGFYAAKAMFHLIKNPIN